MTRPIEEHARLLGGIKTIERLRAINIATLEDLAEASIDKIRLRLECTTERAQVLINRARRAVAGKIHHPRTERSERSIETLECD